MKITENTVILIGVFFGLVLSQSRAEVTPHTGNVSQALSFSGIVTGADGKPLSGQIAITFSLYSQPQGGYPLWSEMQPVEADAQGRYTVVLGSANSADSPLELVATGAARWLLVHPDLPGIEDSPRILLPAAQSALQVANTEAFVDKPATAKADSQVTAVLPETAVISPSSTITGAGTTNYIPIWTSGTTLGDSLLFQSAGNLGIGTATPGWPLTLSSNPATLPPGISYLAEFSGSGSGNSNGSTDDRGLYVSLAGNGSSPILTLTGFTGEVFNSLSAQTIGLEAGMSTNLWVTGNGITTNGYGYRSLPVLTGSGSIGTWQAFDARTPSISGGSIGNAFGMYIEPQKAFGVAKAYGVYQAGSSDVNFLAGSLGIGTATPAANLEVSGTAKFDGAVTLGGSETATGSLTTKGQLISSVATGTAPLQVTSTTQVNNLNASLLGGMPASAFASLVTNTFSGLQTMNSGLNVTGYISNSLLLQPSVVDGALTSANVIGGFGGNKSYSGNYASSGVTGATIAGGGGVISSNSNANVVLADFGTISGGADNSTGQTNGTGQFATVSGGLNNTASGEYATVMGGLSNTASGQEAMVVGGTGNTASGSNSFAAGQLAHANDIGSFVWCQQLSPCSSSGLNSFTVSVIGPIYFYDGSAGTGCNLTVGGGSWACSSDRNLKDKIESIDSKSVLERVAKLPISEWTLKTDSDGHRHIGPMAQDFYTAFGLGESDKYIAQGDAQGVALASIQGLYRMVKEKDEQVAELVQQKREDKEEIELLKRELRELERRINR